MRTLLMLLCIAPLVVSASTDGIIKKQSENSVPIPWISSSHWSRVKASPSLFGSITRPGPRLSGRRCAHAELLIFGNPKVGSALMSSNITVGLDLPVKVLVWEDEQGRVWLAYNDPQLSRRTPRNCRPRGSRRAHERGAREA